MCATGLRGRSRLRRGEGPGLKCSVDR